MAAVRLTGSLLLALVASSWSARAGQVEPQHGVEIGLGFFGEARHASANLVFIPSLQGQYRLSPERYVHAQWHFVGLVETSETGGWSQFRMGNPFVSLNMSRGDDVLHWVAGVGLTLPLARLDREIDRQRTRDAYSFASGARGLWDLWLWAPERMSVVAPFAIEWEPRSAWILGGEAALAVMLPVGTFATGRTDIVLQAAAHGSGAYKRVRWGLRLQMVLVLTQPRDQAQLAAGPFVLLDLDPLSLLLDVRIPFGNPLGRFGLWSINLAARIGV